MKIATTTFVSKLLILLSIILLGLLSQVYGQQQSAFTQYMFNSLVLNPAYAGYSGGGESVDITVLAREQWIGVDGAPSTQTLSAHSPIRNMNMGIGLQIMHDKIGPSREVGAYASYSYHIPISKKRFDGKIFKGGSKLALGIQAGMSHFRNELSSLRIDAQGDTNPDPNFALNDVSKVMFNFGAGAYYYNQHFYVGFSVPYILNNTLGEGSSQARHMFLTGGYLFKVTPSIKIKPSMLLKSVSGAPLQADINISMLIKNIFWVGVSWRSFAAISMLAEYQITNKMRLGYAYDLTTSDFSLVGNNTHEFRLNYRIPLGDIKILNPRCF